VSDAATGRIGPGRLVLVVGPSGAGKDSVMRAARDQLAGDPAFVFPRRIITRPPSEAEDNCAVAPDTFTAMVEAGGFALAWEAHGLSYAIPAAIDLMIAEGKTAICNVSRNVVAAARGRYETVLVIEITAPADVLAARLAARARPQDGDVSRRLARSDKVARAKPDVTIDNTGPIEGARDAFLAALRVGPKMTAVLFSTSS
jgi:ribose 1,5-bisphosphokinase